MKRNKQVGTFGIFLRSLITTSLIFFSLIAIFGCTQITQNIEETIQIGEAYKTATIKWLCFDVSKIAVITNNAVNVSKIGDYKVTYMFGFKILSQIVHVVDTQAPEIVLEGEKELKLKNLASFLEPGYTARDNYDGDLTKKVKVVHIPDDTEPKKYHYVYSVIDSSGNEATAERIVYIE